jgi:acyl carrier protein
MGELEKLMTSVLVCEPRNLPAESTPLRDIEGWDSLKHVLLIVGLEKRLNAKLTAEQIEGIVTLADVGHLLRREETDV